MDTPESVLAQIDEEWQMLLDVLARVRAGRMGYRGVAERWSVKDILGHLMTWEYEVLHAIEAHARNETAPPRDGDLDEWNERAAASLRPTSLAVILIQMGETHGRLVSTLQAMPADDAFASPILSRLIREDTWEHYREHRDEIERWLLRHEG